FGGGAGGGKGGKQGAAAILKKKILDGNVMRRLLALRFALPVPALQLLAGLLQFPLFFSSRRRHTRLVSDWSSDVCPSDLNPLWTRRRPHSGFSRARRST